METPKKTSENADTRNFFQKLFKMKSVTEKQAEREAKASYQAIDTSHMVTDLKSKYDTGLFVTKGSTGKGTYTSTKFTNKEILMSVGSTGGTTYNYTENFTTGVAALPQADANDGKVIMFGRVAKTPTITTMIRRPSPSNRSSMG